VGHELGCSLQFVSHELSVRELVTSPIYGIRSYMAQWVLDFAGPAVTLRCPDTE